jgi:uncharacterized membrane protein
MEKIARRDLGIRILAVSTIGFGIACFLQRDFTIFWQPFPESLPFRQPLAFLSAGLLVLNGAALLHARTARLAALVQIVLFLFYATSWLPRLINGPEAAGGLLGIAEHVSIVVGAATIWVRLSPGSEVRGFAPGARIVFGLCSMIFALAHFIGYEGTARLIPAWIPGDPIFWALFTGAAHLAVGLALIADRLAILATRMGGLMYLCFAAFVWLPGAVSHPDQWLRWAGMSISLAMMGGIWVVGDYLSGRESGERDSKARGWSGPARPETV